MDIKSLKSRILAGATALAMVCSILGALPTEPVKAASTGVTLTEGDIYKFADCEWMAVDVNDEYATIALTKGNTDHGNMSGYWPGFIKNGNSNYDQSISYENISSYYPGLSYLYDQIKDKEYAAAQGDGLYLLSKDDVSEIASFDEVISNSTSFGTADYYGYTWLGNISDDGNTAWRIGYNQYTDAVCTQSTSFVIAPFFNIDTSLLSYADIQSVYPASVIVNGTTYNTSELSAVDAGSFFGIHYKIYNNGLCVMTGEQNSDSNSFSDKPWNLYPVTQLYVDYASNGKDQDSIFNNMSDLEYIEFGNNFNTSNTTNFNYMFRGCEKLTSIDLSNLNMDSATTICGLFENCKKLSSIDLTGHDFSSVTNVGTLFNGCESLLSVNLTGVDFSAVKFAMGLFDNCENLVSADLSCFANAPLDSNTNSTNYMFENCVKLVKIWLPSTITKLDINTFSARQSMPGMNENAEPLSTTTTIFTDAPQKKDSWDNSNDDSKRVFTDQTIYGSTMGQYENATLNNIEFRNSDNATINNQGIVTGRNLAVPNSPTLTGYTFTGWSEDGIKVISLPATATESKTYTAVYAPNKYTIRYDANGGSGSMNDTVAPYDQNVALSNNTFTKSNNTFKGWATASDGSVTFGNGDTVRNLSADNNTIVTLYAVWESKPSSGGSSGGGGGVYVPVQPSKPEEKPAEPSTTKISESIDSCSITGTITKDADGKITSVSAEISVNAAGDISTNKMSVTIPGIVIAKLKELAGSADMKLTINVYAPDKSIAATISSSLNDLCSGSRLIRVESDKAILVPATLTAKSDNSILLTKLTPKFAYNVLSSADYSATRKAIYNSAKLAKKSASIKCGKSVSIKLTPKFDRKNVKKIIYSSSNKKRAVVSKSGKVNGKRKGTAIIKVKIYLQDGTKKVLSYKIKVK